MPQAYDLNRVRVERMTCRCLTAVFAMVLYAIAGADII
jgi:hypothetical protein